MKSFVLAALAVFSTCVFANQTETHQFEASDLRSVQVQNLSGDIKLYVGSGSQAIVKAQKVDWHEKCALSAQKTIESLEVVVTESGPGSFFKRSCKANISIEVPAKVALKLKNGAGNIDIDGIQGDIEFKLGSGDVKIDSETPSVKGTAGSGDIEILGEMGSTSLRTGSGDIRIVLKNPIQKGLIDIKTGSGDAEITLPDSMNVVTDFKAGSGSVNSEFGSDLASEFRVSMRAGSGDLKILKRK